MTTTPPIPHEYETVSGTEPVEAHEHEARTKKHIHGADLYMMTEIGDGVFVQWADCRRCNKRVKDCTCPGGPQEADFMAKWHAQRFERSLNQRGPHDRKVLDSVLLELKDRGYAIATQSEVEEAVQHAQVAQDAAYGDSNDEEIDYLRDALEFALSLLGQKLPEGVDPDDEDDYDPGAGETVGGTGPGVEDVDLPEPDVDDERDHAETAPDGDARTYDPEPDIRPNLDQAIEAAKRAREDSTDVGF